MVIFVVIIVFSEASRIRPLSHYCEVDNLTSELQLPTFKITDSQSNLCCEGVLKGWHGSKPDQYKIWFIWFQP